MIHLVATSHCVQNRWAVRDVPVDELAVKECGEHLRLKDRSNRVKASERMTIRAEHLEQSGGPRCLQTCEQVGEIR